MLRRCAATEGASWKHARLGKWARKRKKRLPFRKRESGVGSTPPSFQHRQNLVLTAYERSCHLWRSRAIGAWTSVNLTSLRASCRIIQKTQHMIVVCRSPTRVPVQRCFLWLSEVRSAPSAVANSFSLSDSTTYACPYTLQRPKS
jgi:hypothetical protein